MKIELKPQSRWMDMGGPAGERGLIHTITLLEKTPASVEVFTWSDSRPGEKEGGFTWRGLAPAFVERFKPLAPEAGATAGATANK
jgi:hypothetical protein